MGCRTDLGSVQHLLLKVYPCILFGFPVFKVTELSNTGIKKSYRSDIVYASINTYFLFLVVGLRA